MEIYEIFTPNDEPTVTYVQRSGLKLEETLRRSYEMPKMVVSISGPSKSGKTVLINKVISQECMIPIVGAGISSPANLWERALQWMEVPASTTSSSSDGGAVSLGGKAGGEAGIPLVAKGKAEASTEVTFQKEKGLQNSFYNDPLPKVISEIANSEFCIFIDDFHYIREEFREEIGKQIKVASDAGVKIITASVPHRTDDVVRSNTELHGRVAAVNLDYWKKDELALIPRLGFAALNAEIAPHIETRLAAEAFGSPQLMQSICLNLCDVLGVSVKLPEQKRLRVSEENIREALLKTSAFSDFSKTITSLQTGPRKRGTERKIHSYNDGSSGDVYRAVLLAISQDPPVLSFTYDSILNRIRDICITDTPVGSSVTNALEQMNNIAEQLQPNSSPLAWDGDNLDIVNPYLLFFLRCSKKLDSIK